MAEDYVIITGTNVDELTKGVLKKMDEEFEPLGGVSVNPLTGELYQAMVLYTEE